MEPTQHTPQTRRGTLALVLAGVTAVGILSAPGSLAYLQKQHRSEAISLHTGSAALTVSEPMLENPVLAPGRPPQRLWYPVDIHNAGSVPLSLTIAVSSDAPTSANFSGNVAFTVWITTDTCDDAPASDRAWTGTTLASAHTVIGDLEPGERTKLCAQAELPDGTPDSARDTDGDTWFEIEVVGTQVAE